MQCAFVYQDGVATCGRCGRVVRSAATSIHAECRVRERPGTVLAEMLAKWPFYISVSAGCSCKRHAAAMDAWGCDLCEANISTIVGWLRDEAAKRRLPFVDAAGRMLVRRAIKKARKLGIAGKPENPG